MTVDYSLDANDLLTHQLYFASKSERIKKKRRRLQILGPLVYCVLGLILFEDRMFSAIIFFMLAILWYIFYPKWEKRRYIKHYEAFIKENFKERLGRIVTTEFNKDYIVLKDSGSESKILTTEIEEIVEIPSSVLVKLRTGHGLIMPNNKVKNIDLLKEELRQLAAHLNIHYSVDSKWEWK